MAFRNLAILSLVLILAIGTPSYAAPYLGSPSAIPGKIEAENYDTGGEGVAYHDTDAGNSGGQYRPTEGVDIESCSDTGGGYNVGWTNAGEWLEYTVNVSTAGTYNIETRVASASAGGTCYIEFNGVNKTGNITVPVTGGWQNWTTVNATAILSAGTQIMRFYEVTSGYNVNYFNITAASTVTVPNVVGQAQVTAQSNITGANLTVGAVTNMFSNTVTMGDIISQYPVGGTIVPAGTPVNFVVSKGSSTFGLSELGAFVEHWLGSGCGTCGGADLSGDGNVDFKDFAMLAANWLVDRNPATVVINEFMASNKKTIADSQGEYDDWIELYNYGTKMVDMGGMYIADDSHLWQIPAGVSLNAGGYLLIWADDAGAGTGLHASFKLSASGDQVRLFKSDGTTLIDSITFGVQTTDISYGRYPDGSSSWYDMSTPTPLQPNNRTYLGAVADIEFSHYRGFYSSSINVGIICDTPDAKIHYTLDGSEPTESSTLYTSPILISSTTCLRAKAFKDGWMPTNIGTQTYIFLADVITQSPTGSAPGPGWPTGLVNGQMIDYGMDPDVVYDSRYVGLVDDALLAIPTISLVTDLDNLFDPSTGIYVNAAEDGDLWERPASVELINPDGSEGFQIDAGLRIRGGWSRHPENPKHAFRLFFRSEYGNAKLNYPLFDNEGVDEFEKIDLRTEENYSWSYYGDVQNTMVREVFSRDVQGQMGQPYTRSRYYHLYINGQYWGIYQTQERPEARYAASYFGGNVEDYDVVKVTGWPDPSNRTEATDGNLVAYEAFWATANAGFSSNTAYYQAQGLNPDGTRNPAYKVQLDVDNLIDYMLGIFYSGDFDAPISWFGSNTTINNFYAIYNRDGQEGWKFFRHDGEHTLLAHVSGYEQSIDRTGPYSAGSWVGQFNPQWLHQQLTANPEYVMRFADRVYKHFFNEGPLKASAAVNTFMSRKNQINSAIIAESARWGDAKVSPPRTKDDDWLPTINAIVSNFFPTRTSVVLSQLRTKGWYPNIDPPTFNQRGGHVSDGFSLTMTNPNGTGTIYYTLNGIDPRGIGGTVVGTAYTVPITLNASVQVKARIKSGTSWSALNTVTFAVGPVASNLRITELMYHPEDTGNPDDPNKEFIELKNIGASAINLNLVKFTNGVEFTFPNTSLAPGGYVLVVKDQTAFVARYGSGFNSIIAGEYSGSLNNAGEEINLVDAVGTKILDFTYSDEWYPITDGNDFTLNIINPANPDVNSWNLEESWQASNIKGGSPGAAYASNVAANGAVVINEVLTHQDDPVYGDWIELYNTTASPINIGGWFLSDNDENFKKYEIAAGTTIPANGYKVFTEDANFSNTGDAGCHTVFALSELGEQVFLSSGSGGQLSGGYSIKQDFGAMTRDVTIGRYTKSAAAGYDVDFTAMASATKGAANSGPLVPDVVINEIMYHSGNQYDRLAEYIELYNRSGSTVKLYDVNNPTNTWKFTNGIDFTFPAGVTLGPGKYLLVSRCNPTIFRTVYSVPSDVNVFGPFANGTALANDGEKVELSKPETPEPDGYVPYIRVEQVNYSDGSHPAAGAVSDPWPTTPDGGGKSLGRKVPGNYGNDVDNWQAVTPSPGVAN